MIRKISPNDHNREINTIMDMNSKSPDYGQLLPYTKDCMYK